MYIQCIIALIARRHHEAVRLPSVAHNDTYFSRCRKCIPRCLRDPFQCNIPCNVASLHSSPYMQHTNGSLNTLPYHGPSNLAWAPLTGGGWGRSFFLSLTHSSSMDGHQIDLFKTCVGLFNTELSALLSILRLLLYGCKPLFVYSLML